MPPRPLILIHTGLTGSDYDGVYGTLLYLKNLVRSGRFACPYALELIQRYRLAWVPLGASWHQAWGWSNLDDPEPLELPLSFDPSELAAVIEITSTQCRLVRLLVSEAKMHQRIADLLPPASHPLLGGRFFYRAVPDGQPLSRFAARTWQSQELVPHCVADDGSSFVSPYTRQAIAAGKAGHSAGDAGHRARLCCQLDLANRSGRYLTRTARRPAVRLGDDELSVPAADHQAADRGVGSSPGQADADHRRPTDDEPAGVWARPDGNHSAGRRPVHPNQGVIDHA